MLLPESAHLRPGSDFLMGLAEANCEPAVLGSSAFFAKPDEALAECRAYIKVAASVDCPIVRVFGGQLPEGVGHAEAAEGIAPALREACEIASDHGVTIGLETHDSWSRGDECAVLLETVDHPALGIVWDAHHSYRRGERPEETMAAIGDWIVHVHLKDGLEQGGKAQYELFGEGDLPLAEMLAVLDADGYTAFLSLEWEKKWHPDLAEPEVAFPQFRSKLDEMLAQIA